MKEARRVKVDGREAGYAEVMSAGSSRSSGPFGGSGKQSSDPMIALVAQLMDSMFYIPGTKIRFGLDPLVGLVPGVGDSAGTIVSVALIGMSARYGIPRVVLARMALNAAINGVAGTVPIAGDAFSIWFKSNQMNYELLKKHAREERPSTRADWIFVAGLIAAVLLIVGAAIALLVTFWIAVFRWIF